MDLQVLLCVFVVFVVVVYVVLIAKESTEAKCCLGNFPKSTFFGNFKSTPKMKSIEKWK
jgi:hypothetical protein